MSNILITSVTTNQPDVYGPADKAEFLPWLAPNYIQKAINNGGSTSIGMGIVTIIDDNKAQLVHNENDVIETCFFLRKKWGVRYETFGQVYPDTQYNVNVCNTQEEAIKEYMRLKPLLELITRDKIYSLMIIEIWQ